jgi:hypothetical protein
MNTIIFCMLKTKVNLNTFKYTAFLLIQKSKYGTGVPIIKNECYKPLIF